MKLPGGKEFRAVAIERGCDNCGGVYPRDVKWSDIKGCGLGSCRPTTPKVRLQLLMFGVPFATEEAESSTVRQLAAELLLACDLAEGRAA